MKKFYLFFTLLTLSVVSTAQTPILTMIADGDCSGGNPKVIEIYASGTVDFSLYSIEIQTNASTTWASTESLAALGTITDDFVYLHTSGSAAAFATEFANATNAFQVGNAVNFNGNDRFRIIETSSSTVIDQYGETDTDGVGTAWEYTDGFAKRNNSTGPDGGFVQGNWTYSNGGLNGAGSCQSGATFESIIGIGSYTAGVGCNLSANGLTAVSCNDAGTSSDPVDDYITFDLNPTGSNLGTTYSVSVASGTITPTTGTYGAATSFQLQAGSAGAGDVTVTITDDTDGGCTIDATVTDPGACSSATPVITVTPSSLTGFNHQVGTPSAEQTFTASGIALTDDIVLTAPADYEISETSGTGFTNSITLTQTAGTVAATTIYVRANAAAMGVINQEIVATSTGADNDTVFVEGYADDYVYYTIDEISTVDANGVADSMDVLVELTGVVHCMDFDGNSGYSITMIDGSGEGINVFAFNDVPNYTSPASGDSLRVFGKIGQFNGLLQVEVDSIELLAQGAALMTPTVVTMLDETTESQYITLENLTFVNPIATFGSNENLDVTDGVNTFTIRIDGDTDLPGTPAPQVSFSVTGVGGQFDNSSPYTGSYQLFPCGTSSFVPSCTMPVNTVSVTGTTATADATGVTYQWIDCSDDSEINGETNASFTPAASGDYAVIVTDGECADTSDCVSIQLSGVGMNELFLEHAITVFPNPVQDVLTITNTSMDVLTVEVFTIGGQAIGTSRTVNATATIETQSWTKGVYFVVFSNESGQTHTERIIK